MLHRSRLMDLAQDILIVLDTSGNVLDVNEAAALMHGGELSDFIGKNCADFLHEESAQRMLDVAVSMFLTGEDATDRMRLTAYRADGSDVFLELRVSWSQSEERFYVVERDVTEEVQRTNELERLSNELRRQSLTDPLTDMPNRLAFDQAMQEIQSTDVPASLGIIDINEFKAINDTLGHVAGDELLKHIARQLRSVLSDAELAARIGGDEFAYVIRDFDADTAQRRFNEVSEAVNGAVVIAGGRVRINCAVGFTNRECGESVSSWIGRADRAMYERKAEMTSERRAA